jgi:hypothetical protein
MIDDKSEAEVRKKAIFDSMSRKGQERVLRMGYENWNPFQEPKDPRERIFSSSSVQANALIQEFLTARGWQDQAADFQKDLFDLCRALIQGEARARMLLDFCVWYQQRAR